MHILYKKAFFGVREMYRLTDIISKPVISIADGKQVGTAESAVFNKSLSKLTHISVFDLELEDKVYIPSSLILSMEKEAVMVKGAALEDPPPEENCPINAFIYDEQGGLLGRTADIILDKNFSVAQIEIAGGGNLCPQNIISFSKHTIVACFDVEKAKKLKRLRAQRTRSKKAQSNEEDSSLKDTIAQVIEMLPLGLTATARFYDDFSGEDGNGEKKEKQPQEIIQESPQPDESAELFQAEDGQGTLSEHDIRRIVPPFSYLIGRKVTADLYGLSDKPLIKKDTIITAKHIDLCRRHGKLIALAKNSKSV